MARGPGSLIVFEGIDGAGKTTQSRLLVSRIREAGIPVFYTKEPTDGPYGTMLRNSARTGRFPPERELSLFLEDRMCHLTEFVGPALERGEHVVMDRYYLSTAAYQGARGLDPAEVLAMNETFTIDPDVCILLTIQPEVGVSRVRRRDTSENLFERTEDLRRCHDIYEGISRPWIRRVDGSASVDEVSSRIREIAEEYGLFAGACQPQESP